MTFFLILRVLWGRSHLRWTERQCKRVLWSDESTFQLFFVKNGRWILHAKDEKGISERHMLPSRRRLCLFQKGNAKPHSARVTTAWFRCHRMCLLDCPACSPDLSSVCLCICILNLPQVDSNQSVETSQRLIRQMGGT